MAIGFALAGAAIAGGLSYGTSYFALAMSAGWAVGAFIGTKIFAPETTDQQGPRLEDKTVQSSAYGSMIPIVFGGDRLTGELIWSQDIKEKKHKNKVEGGKGGGGGDTTYYTYTYSQTFAVLLCEGPITGISRIWLDGKPWYDVRFESDLNIPTGATGKYVSYEVSKSREQYFTLYKGTETQTADPTMESFEGSGNVPAYRGWAYMVFEDLPLALVGNHTPNVSVEVIKDGSIYNEEWEFTFGATMTALKGMAVDETTGNMVCWDTDDRKIKVFRGISNELFYEFSVPDKIDNDNDIYPNCLTMHGGNLYIYVIDQNGGGIKNRVFKMNGVSPNIKQEIELPDGSNYYYCSCIGFSESGDLLAVFVSQFWTDDRFTRFNGFSDTVVEYYDDSSSGQLVVWIDQDSGGDLKHFESTNDTHYVHDGFSSSYKSSFTITNHSNDLVEFDVYQGNAVAINNASLEKCYVYDGISNTILSVDTLGPLQVEINNVIDELAARVGIDATWLNYVWEGEGCGSGYIYTRGYKIAKVMSMRQAIEPLMIAHQFDAAEYDYKLNFIRRGGCDPVYTITVDDLAAHEYGAEMPAALAERRQQDAELPVSLALRYKSRGLDYNPNSQRAVRIVKGAKGRATLDLPMVLDNDEAKQTAEILLKMLWLDRRTFRFSTTLQYFELTPADPVVVDGRLMRVTKMNISGGRIEFECAAEHDDAYTSSASAGDTDYQWEPIEDYENPFCHFLDIPLLDDLDDSPGFYAAMHGVTTEWSGGKLYISQDGGVTFTEAVTVFDSAIVGYANDALGDAPASIIDNENTVSVRLMIEGATLASSTKAGVLNGANMCLIGSESNGYELLHFITATLEADGSYTLSGLLRGARGTEWATGVHQQGDLFVLISGLAGITRVDLSADLIGAERFYRYASFGQNLVDAPETTFTNNAVGLEPYSPVKIRGSRDGSDDLTITWERRNRLSGEWRDNIDVPMDEDSELYDVEIMDGSTVKRTFGDLTSKSQVYTAAQQTTDFGSAQAAVAVKIYQKSATVGRGYAGEATI